MVTGNRTTERYLVIHSSQPLVIAQRLPLIKLATLYNKHNDMKAEKNEFHKHCSKEIGLSPMCSVSK